jgi:hypothetical protein
METRKDSLFMNRVFRSVGKPDYAAAKEERDMRNDAPQSSKTENRKDFLQLCPRATRTESPFLIVEAQALDDALYALHAFTCLGARLEAPSNGPEIIAPAANPPSR